MEYEQIERLVSDLYVAVWESVSKDVTNAQADKIARKYLQSTLASAIDSLPADSQTNFINVVNGSVAYWNAR